MQGQTEELEKESAILKRIAGRLMSVAVLAEHASRLPFPVRAFILWCLRQFETVVMDYAGYEWPDDGYPCVRSGNTPAHALWLAEDLRTLAAEMRALARQAARVERWHDRYGGVYGDDAYYRDAYYGDAYYGDFHSNAESGDQWLDVDPYGAIALRAFLRRISERFSRWQRGLTTAIISASEALVLTDTPASKRWRLDTS